MLMKAVLCTGYGAPEVLVHGEAPMPVPADDELLIKIHATAVTQSDIFIRGLKMKPRNRFFIRMAFGLVKPRQPILGIVLSGVVEKAGSRIIRFKPGDEVYGLTGFSLATYAEYKCMKENDSPKGGAIALKPRSVSHEEATAAAYGGLLGLQYLEKGNPEKGKKVLIYGASGTSGTIAVQYAKYRGAEVTGVCSRGNIDFVKSLGADKVIDYTREDAADALEKYDIILDSVGGMKTSPLKKALPDHLNEGGAELSIDDGNLLLDSARLERIAQLVDAGHIKPVVDKVYPFEEIQAAHEYVEKGHKRGGVAVTVSV